MPAQNRPYLGCKTPRIPLLLIDAEFEIDSVKKLAVRRMRLHKKLTHFEPVERRSVVPRKTIERQIEPLLEPIGDSIRPLGNSHQRVIRLYRAGKRGSPPPIRREIVVDHQIELADVCDGRIVNLDLVGLCKR